MQIIVPKKHNQPTPIRDVHFSLPHSGTNFFWMIFPLHGGHQSKIINIQSHREHYSTKIDFKTQTQDLWEGLPESGDIQKNWQRDIQHAEKQLEELS